MKVYLEKAQRRVRCVSKCYTLDDHSHTGSLATGHTSG